ncbi:MFS transporter [Lancefieldella rimae]|uniref:Transporter, major facilitator family protein n=2 Tax=Lancefieldella rimae TaxID=1383 RepID=B9CKS6_LANR4|nr:MFS transporter [Lancefieldella rimae]EEE17784.1 transporter, major facilitator family protein [Lancefieldella rimae ATCC 49626]
MSPSTRTSRDTFQSASRSTSRHTQNYAYAIVASCIAIMFFPCAIILTCFGIFITPVTQYFGVPKVSFSLVFSVICLTMMVALPITGRLLKKYSMRTILTIDTLLCGLAYGAMGLVQAVWQLYICGIVIGIGLPGLIFLAVPTLIGNWFSKRVGFFTGLCFAFTGIGGALFNPIGSTLIASGSDGWRMCYFIFAAIILACTLPFTFFVVRDKPSDLGLLPMGSDEKNVEASASTDAKTATESAHAQSNLDDGISAHKALRMPSFFMIGAFYALITLNQQISQFFPSYAATFAATAPEIATAGGLIAGAVMVGQAVGKVVLGALNDTSERIACFAGVLCGVVGLVLLWLKITALPIMLLGAALFGVVYAMTTVETPILVRAVFGNKDYTIIYSRIAIVSSLMSAIALVVWSLIVDGSAGGYDILFGLGFALMLSCLILALFALRNAHWANCTR